MGKKKKKPKKQTEKELLEQQLLKYQKWECLTNIFLAVISIISVIVTAIINWFDGLNKQFSADGEQELPSACLV